MLFFRVYRNLALDRALAEFVHTVSPLLNRGRPQGVRVAVSVTVVDDEQRQTCDEHTQAVLSPPPHLRLTDFACCAVSTLDTRLSGGHHEAHKSNHVSRGEVKNSGVVGTWSASINGLFVIESHGKPRVPDATSLHTHKIPCDARQFLPMTEEVQRPCTSLQEVHAPTMTV